MEKTPPKGMFKKGSTVHVWIAQDDPIPPMGDTADTKSA